jgi:radical SAM superfamily enzyme YgiQ (UPF0313 family)
VLTVVGGHHATVVPEDFASPDIDLIVMGEGVFTFKEIVARFERGEGFEGVPGVAFKGDGALVKTAPAPVRHLDIFPSSSDPISPGLISLPACSTATRSISTWPPLPY